MTENVSCLFSIDSDSRFSEKDCPRCAHLYDKSDDEDDPPCCEEWYTAPPGLGGADPLYSGLPHVKWGWNEFEAELREEVVYYKNKPVLTLEEIKRFDKGIHSWNQDKEDEEERKEKKSITLAKKKMRSTLKSQLQKLDADIDKIMDSFKRTTNQCEMTANKIIGALHYNGI